MNYIQQAYKGELEYWKYLVFSSIFFGIFGFNFYAMYFLDIEIKPSENKIADLATNLFAFFIFFVMLLLWVKSTHKQSITSLTTSREKIDFKRIFFSFSVWAIISIALFIVSYFSTPELFEWNFDTKLFLNLFIVSIFLFPFQTSFEEYFFRGYLMQAIGTKFGKASAILITSVLFGLVHSFNPEVEKLGYLIMVYYIGTGLFLAIITLMDEGLELALGFHFANNLVACLLVSSNWSALQTDAMFIDMSKPELTLSAFLPVFVIYPLLFFLFSKVYKWFNFKEHLFGKVEPIIN